MTTLNEYAVQVIEILGNTATAPDALSPYMTQKELAEAIGVTSMHTMSDIVTRACTLVPTMWPGCAILRSKRNGYRLGDSYTVKELAEERGRLKAVRTKQIRAAIALDVNGAGPESQMIAAQLMATVNTVIEPAIARLDEIITS